jgi:hypothetical protein
VGPTLRLARKFTNNNNSSNNASNSSSVIIIDANATAFGENDGDDDKD